MAGGCNVLILSDFDLRNYIREGRIVVDPFDEEIIRENGLDLRLGDEIVRLRYVKPLFNRENSSIVKRILDYLESESLTVTEIALKLGLKVNRVKQIINDMLNDQIITVNPNGRVSITDFGRWYNRSNGVLDTRNPHNINVLYVKEKGDSFFIHPHERVLLTTLEYIKLPSDIMGFVNLRSTFARLGLALPPTIIDAGFEGQITIELLGSNFPIKLHKGQRFIHVVFSKLTSQTAKPYRGKYQGQRGVVIPKLVES